MGHIIDGPPEPNEESPSWSRRSSSILFLYSSVFLTLRLTIQMCPHTYYTISSNRECHSPIAHVMVSPTQSLGRKAQQLFKLCLLRFAGGRKRNVSSHFKTRNCKRRKKWSTGRRERNRGGHLGGEERRQQRERKTVVHIWSLLNEKCDVSFSLFLCSSYIFLKDDKGRIFGLESRESNMGFHIACNVGQFDFVED